jgi:hypothetical protein
MNQLRSSKKHSCLCGLTRGLPLVLMDTIWERSEWHNNVQSACLSPRVFYYPTHIHISLGIYGQWKSFWTFSPSSEYILFRWLAFTCHWLLYFILELPFASVYAQMFYAYRWSITGPFCLLWVLVWGNPNADGEELFYLAIPARAHDTYWALSESAPPSPYQT